MQLFKIGREFHIVEKIMPMDATMTPLPDGRVLVIGTKLDMETGLKSFYIFDHVDRSLTPIDNAVGWLSYRHTVETFDYETFYIIGNITARLLTPRIFNINTGLATYDDYKYFGFLFDAPVKISGHTSFSTTLSTELLNMMLFTYVAPHTTEGPRNRSNSRNDCIFVFGGSVDICDANGVIYTKYSSRMFVINVSQKEVFEIRPRKTPCPIQSAWPEARDQHCGCFVPSLRKYYMFGGIVRKNGVRPVVTGDFWEFDIDTVRWTKIETTLTGQSRRQASLVCINDRLYLIGGFGVNGDAIDEVWMFNIQRKTWACMCENTAHLLTRACTFVINDAIHVIGHHMLNDFMEVLTPAEPTLKTFALEYLNQHASELLTSENVPISLLTH
jgi:hypothetical protein